MVLQWAYMQQALAWDCGETAAAHTAVAVVDRHCAAVQHVAAYAALCGSGLEAG